jgi:hypothetical protein
MTGRRWRQLGAVAIGATLFSSAAEPAEIGRMLGLGQNLCAQFSKAYADKPSAEEDYWGWATGMMSGLNFASVTNSNVFRDLSGDQDIFRRAVRLYCEKHPLTTYSGAVLDLYVSFPLKKAAAK